MSYIPAEADLRILGKDLARYVHAVFISKVVPESNLPEGTRDPCCDREIIDGKWVTGPEKMLRKSLREAKDD